MLHKQKYNVKNNFKVPSFNVNLSLCPSRLSQNPFQNNKNCESSVTTIYQSEIIKNTYPLLFAIVTERLLWDLSLLYLKSMNGIISCTYWLSSAHFILLRVCCFFLFLSYFRGVHYLLRYGSKFNNTYNKAVKLFLGS